MTIGELQYMTCSVRVSSGDMQSCVEVSEMRANLGILDDNVKRSTLSAG